MTEPTSLRDLVSAVVPEDLGSVGTVVAPHEDAALEALSAYFGAADERQAVHVIVADEELGYLDRRRALALLDVQSRDLDHSSNWALPGISDYEPIQLLCPATGCAANPIFAAGFDERHPPHCPLHPGLELRLAQA